MNFVKNAFKKVKNYTYDHPGLRTCVEYLILLLAAVVSSFIFAYGYKTFVAPIAYDSDGTIIQNIVTGGASGVAQVIVKICELCGVPVENLIGETSIGYIIQSAMYVIINIPLAILAFRKIGKRFALFTAVNVGLYFVFVNILPNDASSFFYSASAGKANLTDQILVRAILAGICTGVSSGLAVQTGHSSGGIDIVSVYVTTKKTNASVGTTSMFINFGIIVVYTILSCIQDKGPDFIPTAIYSFVYFLATSIVVDAIAVRNKKKQLQIVTSNEQLVDILITYFPHSATYTRGQGAYTKEDRIIIYTVISSKEVKRAIKIIKEEDPKAFITVTNVEQLVGRFYIEPNK